MLASYECIREYGLMINDDDLKHMFKYLLAKDGPSFMDVEKEEIEGMKSMMIGTPSERAKNLDNEFDDWTRDNEFVNTSGCDDVKLVKKFDRKAVLKPSHGGAKIVTPVVSNNCNTGNSLKATSYTHVAKASGCDGVKVNTSDLNGSGDNDPHITLKHVNSNDFPLALLGCYKDFRAIANSPRNKFLKHNGFLSWFSSLKPWHEDFVVEERLIWLEIEGVPLRAWHNDTLSKRLCIKSSHDMLVFATIMVSLKGISYAIRVRELYSRTPNFVGDDSYSDDEGSIGMHGQEVEGTPDDDHDVESAVGDDLEKVHNSIDDAHVNVVQLQENTDEKLHGTGGNDVKPKDSDPFGLDSLIQKKCVKNTKLINSDTPEFPHGFSPNMNEDQLDSHLDAYKWGSKMSKLDRFLVSEGFLDVFPHSIGVVLEKGSPDHRPILLRESKVDYGPTLFRELSDLAQKGKIKWDLEGDENSSFLHEIKRAIWDCSGDRASGLDGFTFKFITAFWDLLEADVMTTSSTNNSVFRGFFKKQKLTGPNFIDWTLEEELSSVFSRLLKKKKNAASGAGGSGVISISYLYEDGFVNRFVDNTIQVSRNNMVYFSAIPRDGIFEIDLSNSLTNESSIYVVSKKSAKLDLDSALLWHCLLGHISKKRIEKLQHDGLLDSSDLRAFEKYVSCMSEKMARKPYTQQVERAKDLFRLIHTDVCGPFKIMSRQGASYFVTFTDDFSRYGYIYLLKHKHEVFETFKVFQKEVENQLEASGSLEDLEIIQEEDTRPSIDTSLNHKDDDLEIDEPQRDLGEPTNYKAALLDPESEKWLNAMNVEMQSMKDNKFWVLVELPPSGKTVGSKWLFNKKTNMDRNETFSPVADIRAIRILIAIAAYYDYEIWQMDVKTAFLNGYLNEETVYLGKCFAMKDLSEAAYILGIKIYRDRSRRLIGLCQSAYIKKILKRYVSLEKSNKNVNGLHPTSQCQFSICNRLNGVNGLG
nr:retrotransposon protein, putative, Ty1-copia subclass [Tanacetum cinerariifolium]